MECKEARDTALSEKSTKEEQPQCLVHIEKCAGCLIHFTGIGSLSDNEVVIHRTITYLKKEIKKENKEGMNEEDRNYVEKLEREHQDLMPENKEQKDRIETLGSRVKELIDTIEEIYYTCKEKM